MNLNLKNIPQINPKPKNQKQAEKPWTSLIDPEERSEAWNRGYSVDAKKMTEALGFIDMK